MAAGELTGARIGKRSVSGEKRGVKVQFTVGSAGWQVSARVPRGPYVLEVLPKGARLPERDAVRFFDPDFDKDFQAGGRPVELLRDLFDRRLRRRLCFLRPRSLRAAAGRVRLTQSYTYYYAEPEDIAAAIEVVAAVAERLCAFVREVEASAIAEGRECGSPYRGIPDRRRIECSLALRHAAVTRYLDDQHQLKRRERKRAAAAVGVVVGWCAVIVVVNLVTALF